ncbi:hypothetical protein ES705_04766 [subsurface metagenome]
MKVAVVFFSSNNRERLLNLSRALGRGVESQGHQVDIVDGNHDINTKLTIYRYIAVGVEHDQSFCLISMAWIYFFLTKAGKTAIRNIFTS